MKFALSILALAFCLTANAQWTAKNLGGRSLPAYRDAGDLITFDFPLPNQRVSFLTHPTSGSINGATITATFFIEANNPAYTGANVGGCVVPVNVRLYFTSGNAVYKLSTADKYPNLYWWCSQTGAVAYIEQVDDGALVTLTGTVTPTQWSNANGQSASSQLAGFNTAANSPKHIGMAFGGGCFFDTGVGISSGSSTFHLLTFEVQ